MSAKRIFSHAHWGNYETSINEWMDRASKQTLIKRLWQKDPVLWKRDAKAHKEIVARLGWLTAPKLSKELIADIGALALQIKEEGIAHVVLLGMGGSSLAPFVFKSVFGATEGYPELIVLDSTDPAQVTEVESKIVPEKTIFVVSSKSGGTIELTSLYKYFSQKLEAVKGVEAGRNFMAITDPGSPLETLAKERGFRKVFLAPEDVGGRFSALTVFGLVPAALSGIDIEKILQCAERMLERCCAEYEPKDNEAAYLGIGMAVLSEEGRDKLTILSPDSLASFGDWAEQLVAESSGKEGVGIVPVVREPIAEDISFYGQDRFFVALVPDYASDKQEFSQKLEALMQAGHPVLTLKLKETYDIGGEFFRWEAATALACALLKINAFDQPDVQATKNKTKAILKQVEAGQAIAIKTTDITPEDFWENVEPGDYAAILAFLPYRDSFNQRLAQLRQRIRAGAKIATTLGFGPRYLHSTGQLHKGGANNAVFILITAPSETDLPIPGERYGFGQLELAQAMGDFDALLASGRWVIHCRMDALTDEALEQVCARLESAIPASQAPTA
ncbi:MAG: glucose-6-phosphate isomerase [Candidatus Omnitrophota bacterium]